MQASDKKSSHRKIIHIDMDAFFAAIEIRDRPELAHLPVIIGGSAEQRGVLATCNYVARQYGLHSAMPTKIALQRCPKAILITPRFSVYRSVSDQIFEILARFTSLLEPVSIDEAYLDVSHVPDAIALAREIKSTIFKETGLTASAGVSYNKFLAKMASEIQKPDGLSVILPKAGLAFIHALPIGKFHGIGAATARKMHLIGIQTGADLFLLSRHQLVVHFGKMGDFYYDLAHGIDQREVIINHERKSIGAEITLEKDLLDYDQIKEILIDKCKHLCESLKKCELKASTFTIKVKYANFEQVTRSITFKEGFDSLNDLLPYLDFLIQKTSIGSIPIRLIGATASHFIQENHGPIQLELPLNFDIKTV